MIWSRKITFEVDADDWVVLRDGLVVGRVIRHSSCVMSSRAAA